MPLTTGAAKRHQRGKLYLCLMAVSPKTYEDADTVTNTVTVLPAAA